MNRFDDQYIKEELIIREYLSADRTMLAIDRTFLAYIRTALTLFIAGVSLIKFFDVLFLQILGWIIFPFGIITFILGLERCIKMANFIERLAKKHGYKVESAESMLSSSVPQLLITTSTLLKKVFTKAYHALFLSIGHGEERK